MALSFILSTDTGPSEFISLPSNMSSTGGHHSEESDSPVAVLNYISQILMEEGLESATCRFPDAALQAAEKPFYDVLGEKYPSLINQIPSHQNRVSTVNKYNCFCNYYGCKSIVHANKAIESSLIYDLSQQKSSCVLAPPAEFTFQSNFQSNSLSCLQSISLPSNFGNNINGSAPPLCTPLAPEPVVDAAEKGKRDHSPGGMEWKEMITSTIINSSVEPRSWRYKHLALNNEAPERSEMFEKLLLFSSTEEGEFETYTLEALMQNGRGTMLHQGGKQMGARNGRTTGKKERANKRDLVDLRSLLTHCAEAVGGNDLKGANELLLQIRHHSSPSGDGSQRLAHCFANALEARLVGSGSEVYAALAAKNISSLYIFQAFRLLLSACPFMRMSTFFATQTIMNLSKKATKLHIIHFGILYGFQWPDLIQNLSERPGGPPVLRITGIDFPQPGSRPAARIEETGRRLASYCERFKVPFEYNAIAQKWETIQLEDLKINRDEVIVVNCLYQFRYLQDETVVLSSHRDTVLKLIKMIKPDVFIHGIVNGSYNAPFFTSRFREALHYFSALFDMLDANLRREDQDRMVFEQEIYGKEVLNVIACEGEKRVERPETYKQWQVRNLRAGLRQLPLNQEIMKKVETQVKLCYHKDFLVDEDRHWMLQGWKGRILCALSCWKTA
ncbi:scarecrow-like protein 9 [Juglans microcarpa x Juglans regia]|uniref:scarecrow-like protein 9 n=1 Tax=Juglans microcarpa x Juglans regia TaxID=2249226 RepID=UPI001B7EA433|nr:scarecrow-like protein 9 [Juglans microcarpa x Juglans regia]